MKEKKRKDTVFCGFFFVRESESSEKKSSELPAIVVFCGLLIVIICLGIYLINVALAVHLISKGVDTMTQEQTTERSTKSIEESIKSIEESRRSIEESKRSIEESKRSIEKNRQSTNESSAVKRVLTTGQDFDPSNGEPNVAICEMKNGDRLIVLANYDSLSSDLFEANLKTILSEIDEDVQVHYDDNLGGWLVTASSAEADRLSSERLLATSCVLADKLSKPSEPIEAPE